MHHIRLNTISFYQSLVYSVRTEILCIPLICSYRLRLHYSNSDTFGVKESNISTGAGPPFIHDIAVYIQWIGMRQLFVTWVSLEPRHTSNASASYIINVFNIHDVVVLTKMVPLLFENRITLNLDGNEEYNIQLCAQNIYGLSCNSLMKSGTYQGKP